MVPAPGFAIVLVQALPRPPTVATLPVTLPGTTPRPAQVPDGSIVAVYCVVPAYWSAMTVWARAGAATRATTAAADAVLNIVHSQGYLLRRVWRHQSRSFTNR